MLLCFCLFCLVLFCFVCAVVVVGCGGASFLFFFPLFLGGGGGVQIPVWINPSTSVEVLSNCYNIVVVFIGWHVLSHAKCSYELSYR